MLRLLCDEVMPFKVAEEEAVAEGMEVAVVVSLLVSDDETKDTFPCFEEREVLNYQN